MSMDHVNNQYIGTREQVGEIFIDAFGKETVSSVSLAASNREGTAYVQVPAGNVLAQHPADNLFRPCVLDSAQSDVTSANVVSVVEARNFRLNDWVELPESVDEGTGRFRKVTAVDEDNGNVTLNGAAFSLSEGDLLQVDPSRAIGTVEEAGSGRATTLDVDDASKFHAGQLVDIGSATKQSVFTPTVQNDAEYEFTVQYTSPDGETERTFSVDYTSDGSATAKEIVEALQTALEEQDDDDELAVTEDDSKLTVAAEDPDATLEFAVSDNLATTAVEESDTTAVKISSVDEQNDTVTLAEEVPYSNGELIVSEPYSQKQGNYRIPQKTVNTSTYTHTPQNTLIPCRHVGEVREANLRGLLPRAKEVLQGNIRFSSTSN